jgi:hypothetical protein
MWNEISNKPIAVYSKEYTNNTYGLCPGGCLPESDLASIDLHEYVVVEVDEITNR